LYNRGYGILQNKKYYIWKYYDRRSIVIEAVKELLLYTDNELRLRKEEVNELSSYRNGSFHAINDNGWAA
jgi:hypothetical protein